MSGKQIAAGFLVATLTIGVFAFSSSLRSNAAQNNPTAQELPKQEQLLGIPDHVVYGFFLHDIYTFKKKAEEAERKGDQRSAQAYRNFYRGQGRWTDEQIRMLEEIATEYERRVKEVDARAKGVIDQRRALYYPGGKVPAGGSLAPPSTELERLQAERNAIILEARDRIQAGLGEQEFMKLHQFVRRSIAPTVTVTAP